MLRRLALPTILLAQMMSWGCADPTPASSGPGRNSVDCKEWSLQVSALNCSQTVGSALGHLSQDDLDMMEADKQLILLEGGLYCRDPGHELAEGLLTHFEVASSVIEELTQNSSDPETQIYDLCQKHSREAMR